MSEIRAKLNSGDLVVITTAPDPKAKRDMTALTIGTLWGYTLDDKVLVLLPEGYIQLCHKHEVFPQKEQEVSE